MEGPSTFRRAVSKASNEIYASKERIKADLRAYVERLTKKVGLIGSIEFHADDFDLAEWLRKRKGPFVEVGGPTLDGFSMVPASMIPEDKDYFSSNIKDGLYYSKGSNPPRKVASVDFAADARKLPLADGAVGAFFASAQVYTLRPDILAEAARVLEKDGLLIWQAASFEDIALAENAGMELAAYEWTLPQDVFRYLPKELDTHHPGAIRAAVLSVLKEQLSHKYQVMPRKEARAYVGSDDKRVLWDEEEVGPQACIFRKK